MGMDIITTMICRAVVQVLVGTVGSVLVELESTKRTTGSGIISKKNKEYTTHGTLHVQ
jgi:hypothetical protein